MDAGISLDGKFPEFLKPWDNPKDSCSIPMGVRLSDSTTNGSLVYVSDDIYNI